MALSKPRGRLFRKYVVLFVTLVSGALVTSGLVEIYFSYQENKTALGRIQREKAQAAASKIEEFIKEIESRIGWAPPLPGSGEDPGVAVAEVNLKFIWEVASQIKVGKAGQAYVADSRGQLIAHPDISLVLQKTDLSALPHVQAIRAAPPKPGGDGDEATIARDFQARQV